MVDGPRSCGTGAVKGAIYDVVTQFFNGDMSSAPTRSSRAGGAAVGTRVVVFAQDAAAAAGAQLPVNEVPGYAVAVAAQRLRAGAVAENRLRRHAAEDRAGAELRHHPVLRLRLHPVNDLSVVHQFQFCRSSGWSASLHYEPVGIAHWWLALEQPVIFGSLYIVICHRARPAAGDPPRPEDPRRRRAAHDLPLPDGALLHRHRHGVEVVPQSRHRAAEGGAGLGLENFTFDWIMDPEHGDLHHRHRRGLAVLAAS